MEVLDHNYISQLSRFNTSFQNKIEVISAPQRVKYVTYGITERSIVRNSVIILACTFILIGLGSAVHFLIGLCLGGFFVAATFLYYILVHIANTEPARTPISMHKVAQLTGMFARIDTVVLENVDEYGYGHCEAVTAIQKSLGQIKINRLELYERVVDREMQYVFGRKHDEDYDISGTE